MSLSARFLGSFYFYSNNIAPVFLVLDNAQKKLVKKGNIGVKL